MQFWWDIFSSVQSRANFASKHWSWNWFLDIGFRLNSSFIGWLNSSFTRDKLVAIIVFFFILGLLNCFTSRPDFWSWVLTRWLYSTGCWSALMPKTYLQYWLRSDKKRCLKGGCTQVMFYSLHCCVSCYLVHLSSCLWTLRLDNLFIYFIHRNYFIFINSTFRFLMRKSSHGLGFKICFSFGNLVWLNSDLNWNLRICIGPVTFNFSSFLWYFYINFISS